MKSNFLKELPLLLIVAIPFVYLAVVWDSLPERVPTHWELNGNIDGWGSKWELLLIPVLMPLLMYVIFAVIPKLDPKKRLEAMGNKFYQLKFLLTLLMSALATYIIYATQSDSSPNFNFMTIGIGVLFAVLGNYFQSIKPNYFIGIRTPWTLENEEVWRKTHQIGGKLWFAGGLLIILCSLFLKECVSTFIFIGITVIITLIPIIYSYIIFKNIKPGYNNGFKE